MSSDGEEDDVEEETTNVLKDADSISKISNNQLSTLDREGYINDIFCKTADRLERKKNREKKRRNEVNDRFMEVCPHWWTNLISN